MILPLFTPATSKIPKWISDHINYKNISEFTIADHGKLFDQRDFEWIGTSQTWSIACNAFRRRPRILADLRSLRVADAQDAFRSRQADIPKRRRVFPMSDRLEPLRHRMAR
jgi:hypothetical protein